MKYYPRWKPSTPCPNNGAVICTDKTQCFRCGWDPQVERRRKEEQQKRRSENEQKEKSV